MPEKRVRRVWVQNVAVSVKVLETRLDVAEAQGLGPDQKAAAAGVRELLRSARDAAFGVQPRPNRLSNWWRGTLVDAAYQNLHAARALMVDVYDDAEVAAEIPIAVARSQRTLHRDDPRRLGPETFTHRSEVQRRAFLRRIIKDGYDALDRQHERLRSFRNINLTLAVFIAVLVGATVAFVSASPQLIPLCFPASGQANGGALQNCPTGSGVAGPSGDDILVVSLLGLLGGALAAATSIRNLRGTSTPYDVPVALALLKVPLGAFTAILGLVAIRGDFVPGLSALDSQQQILAYALVLGFGQQVFTRSLDRKAQTLLNAIPSKEATVAPPPGAASPAAAPDGLATAIPAQPSPGQPGPRPSWADRPPAGPPAGAIALPPDEPDFQPPPAEDDDAPQDDGSVTLPNVQPVDHR